uniref:RING-type domain-containing protein n=1 Tax=Phasianus colchicus TaxID=9054 RepID=A0A669Q287_PHACC
MATGTSPPRQGEPQQGGFGTGGTALTWPAHGSCCSPTSCDLSPEPPVLPCQHTFCKPCLQRILKSQKELRCPECRTLVLCGIEQLPANLLLIRLLDGVRYGQNAVPSSLTGRGSTQQGGIAIVQPWANCQGHQTVTAQRAKDPVLSPESASLHGLG